MSRHNDDVGQARARPKSPLLRPRRKASRRWPLPHHLLGGLVLSQSDEARMAKPAVPCPLRESDLAHQLWMNPVDTLSWQHPLVKRRIVSPQLGQLGREPIQQVVVK